MASRGAQRVGMWRLQAVSSCAMNNKASTVRGRARGPGRRPGKPDTKEAILDAARAQFIEAGYENVSLRAIADAAGVDPAMINYFFGSKRELFGEAMSLTVNFAEVLRQLLAEGTEDLSERVLRRMLAIWDDPDSGGPLLALLRSATAEERPGALLGSFLDQEVVPAIAEHLEGSDKERRAGLVASQLVGLLLTRYVLRVGVVATCTHEQLVELYRPGLDGLIARR